VQKKFNRSRKKINTKIDANLVAELKSTAKRIDFPASRIVEDGIISIIKKEKLISKNKTKKTSINLTINLQIWNDFKGYAESHNLKLAHLIEECIIHSLKKYNKKIHYASTKPNQDDLRYCKNAIM
jgi:hypothetical protein